MSNKVLNDIINSVDKKIDRATDPLSRLLRIVLHDLDIDTQTFGQLLDRFVRRELHHQLAKDEKSSYKTNLVAAISDDTVTYKTFERFVRILNPKKMELSVKFTWKDNSTTSHSVEVDVIEEETTVQKG